MECGYVSLNGLPKPGTEPAKQYTYDSDCLDFVPLRTGKTIRYMNVARESEAVAVNVWVAEPKRVGVIDPMEEITYENLNGVFA